MRRPAGRWNFTVNGKPAAVDVPPPTAGAKPVSRSSHAKGLRRRAGAHLRRSCHANPIRWLADGFAGQILHAQPRSPVSARQKVNVARTMASERARGCCCACFVFALQWKPLIAQRVGGGVVGLLSPLGQQGGRSETMAC